MKISEQGYLQQRKRLHPEVFSYLDDEYLADFYHSSEPKPWNGFWLLSIDGSKAEEPNSAENRERFGKSNNQHSELGQIRTLVSGVYNILNQICLDIEISHISASETELAKIFVSFKTYQYQTACISHLYQRISIHIIY